MARGQSWNEPPNKWPPRWSLVCSDPYRRKVGRSNLVLSTETSGRETWALIWFDAGSYYAHNEMEMGHWRCEFNSVFRSKVYIRHYLQNYPAAEPVDEFDDRNRLYSIKGAINYAAGHPGSNLEKRLTTICAISARSMLPLTGLTSTIHELTPQ